MNDILTANWPLFVIGTVVVVLLLWWLLIASRRTRVNLDKRDTLDEGATPAARNQALIDAPQAAASATVPPMVPDAVGGAGVAVAAVAQDARIEVESQDGDDLTRIKGLGPKLAATLNGLGISRFEQIAAWTDSDIERVDEQLGRFQGRIQRDNWVEQARFLAAGDAAGFESKFGAV